MLPPLGLKKAGALLLVSRGVVEGKCKEDKVDDLEYGLERVKERLQADHSITAQAVAGAILNERRAVHLRAACAR
jgi:hypothetical protein